jgi:hypothetical protein
MIVDGDEFEVVVAIDPSCRCMSSARDPRLRPRADACVRSIRFRFVRAH